MPGPPLEEYLRLPARAKVLMEHRRVRSIESTCALGTLFHAGATFDT